MVCSEISVNVYLHSMQIVYNTFISSCKWVWNFRIYGLATRFFWVKIWNSNLNELSKSFSLKKMYWKYLRELSADTKCPNIIVVKQQPMKNTFRLIVQNKTCSSIFEFWSSEWWKLKSSNILCTKHSRKQIDQIYVCRNYLVINLEYFLRMYSIQTVIAELYCQQESLVYWPWPMT